MNRFPIRIVISGGHSGGHFFPAFSFAQKLKTAHPEAKIHFLFARFPDFAGPLLSDAGFHRQLIEIPPVPKFFSLKMISFLLQYIFVYIQTFLFILNLEPSLVVGFGSYASIPSVLCASMLRIPILLHEQNLSAGRASRFLSFFANRVGVSFPETRGIVQTRKVFISGYPLREDFLSAFQSPEQQNRQKPFTILIFGGSQGARRLNGIFLEVITQLNAEELKELAVKHIVGNDNIDRIREIYSKLNVKAEVDFFSYKIGEDYRAADLIISRSGAGTVFELIAAGRPAILIPYPHAYAHQKLNAEFLSAHDAAEVLHEEDLTAHTLSETILNLRHNKKRREEIVLHLKQLNQPNSSEHLVEEAWELICKKN